ncbi:MAG: hypothetical protein EZS28_028910 [Streblomastix strix]|uniref:Uncharacterized protein n=1 Tax=Streblomastix strix TaxID=222440 RepID=A0A5J4UZI3_9EUKA|nr:MAG: hypothetical protein EZS28_028910 [Streblomastix strix]
MQTKQEIQNTTSLIISFTDSYSQYKQGKQNEQQESESTLSLAQVTSSLESLLTQIHYTNAIKQVSQIPKLLQSLIALVTFRLGTHIKEQTYMLRLKVRRKSRLCLQQIHSCDNKQIQLELVNQGYGRVTSITFSTAGGIGEEQDDEIWEGLNFIARFLYALHQGRTWQPSFKPLPLLARVSLEQIEEEGAIEEIDAQMNNNGYDGFIKLWANEAKAATLNRFVNRR